MKDSTGSWRIDHKVIEYEGIPAANAAGMALFEASGMRCLIDQHCSYDPEKRTLSPGMVVKALIGPTFNVNKKFPLYKVETAYNTAPTGYRQGGTLYETDPGHPSSVH